MSDKNNNNDKPNLNLSASTYVPKFMTNTNTINPQQQQGYNPYYNNMQGNYMQGQNGYYGGYYPQGNVNNLQNNFQNMNLNNNYNSYGNNQYGQQQYNNVYGNQSQMNTNMINTNNTNNFKNTNTNVINNKPTEPKKQILTNPNNAKDTNKVKTTTTTKKEEKKEVKKEIKKEVKKEIKKEDKPKTETTTEVKSSEVKSEVNNIDLENMELVVDSKEGKMTEVDETRVPISIVFIGHVDHGKSTIAGNILIQSGMVDERTLEKYQKEAKSKNRDSWYIAYIMDSNEDEREKGKTVEIGKAYFKTPSKRYTILDAPGHSGFLPNMLQGACQADLAGLVISAKGGEFEAGFEKSGSTREHVLLAKSLGVAKLIVIVNKMDEESVKWSESRFNQIKSDLSDYLKKLGYNIEKDVYFVPISGLYGDGMKQAVDPRKCPWYKGPCLLDLLDQCEAPKRDPNGPLRITILDRYKEGGMQIMGKVESGIVKYGGVYTLMPTKASIEVQWIFNSEDDGVPYAMPGESVRIKIKGAENETDINRGFIVCSPDNLCGSFNQIIAEIIVLEFPENLPIIANGFSCMMHYHTTIEECSITIMAEIDKKTKEEHKVKFIKSNTRAKVLIKTSNIICGEKFENNQNLGRFTLRFSSTTIAVGKVMKYKLDK